MRRATQRATGSERPEHREAIGDLGHLVELVERQPALIRDRRIDMDLMRGPIEYCSDAPGQAANRLLNVERGFRQHRSREQ